MPGRNRMLGTSGAVQYHLAWSNQSHGRLHEYRRGLHRLHDAGISRSLYALLQRTARSEHFEHGLENSRHIYAPAASDFPEVSQSRAALGHAQRRAEWLGTRREAGAVRSEEHTSELQ